jgi:hypothetical protein
MTLSRQARGRHSITVYIDHSLAGAVVVSFSATFWPHLGRHGGGPDRCDILQPVGVGSAKGSDHFRETDMLSFETIVDLTVWSLGFRVKFES